MTNSVNAEATATTNANVNTFNAWEQVKYNLVKGVFDGSNEFQTRFMSDVDFVNQDNEKVHIDGAEKILKYLLKHEGIAGYSTQTSAIATKDGKVKDVFIVTVEGFNPKATAMTKNGKEYYIFQNVLGRVLAKKYIEDFKA